tara:strand:+ start:238 stop:564 length:327 start_codon:yes stop_codon:yes gene_type:complete
MAKKLKRKPFTFEVIVGRTVEVSVLSSEDDEWGDKASRVIYDKLGDLLDGDEEVQQIGLPSGCWEPLIEGDTVEELKEKADDYFSGTSFVLDYMLDIEGQLYKRTLKK